eukprot:scaffold81795_cov33-Phaeocystis_antarctica.AAC.2
MCTVIDTLCAHNSTPLTKLSAQSRQCLDGNVMLVGTGRPMNRHSLSHPSPPAISITSSRPGGTASYTLRLCCRYRLSACSRDGHSVP